MLRPMAERERIETGAFVAIDGVDQWVTIRGDDRRNPVVLLLHGPGVGFSAMAPLYAPWEKRFTVAQWDQPGAGYTWAKNGDAGMGTLSVERIARDGIAVVEFLRRRLGARKVVLFAVSGGTIVGLRMLKQRPDLFAAYVGNGQIVSWARQESLCYAAVLAQARAAGNASALAELEQIGPPPWRDLASVAIKSKYANVMTPVEQAFFASLGPAGMAALATPPADATYVPKGLTPSDPRALGAATFGKLWPEIAAFDARALGLGFDVPMFFFQGERDLHMVTSEVQAYAAEIRAPRKAIELIKGAGHMSSFLRDDLLALLERHVLPLAPVETEPVR